MKFSNFNFRRGFTWNVDVTTGNILMKNENLTQVYDEKSYISKGDSSDQIQKNYLSELFL